jgi:VanZ family protein
MVIILWMSSGQFSSDRTGSAIGAILGWVAPWLSSAEIQTLHGLGRKLAHLISYAILALLWFRALVRDTALARGAAALLAFAVSVTWAGVDEVRQSFVPSREGSIGHVALDAVGSAIALGFAYRDWVRAAYVLGLILLWFAAVGGLAMLAVNLATGVSSGVLWFTVPTAALVLVAHYWWLPRS